MYTIYIWFLIILFYPLLPLLLFYVLITGKHRQGVRQRLSVYPSLPGKNGRPRIWLHGASIGEVQAAQALMHELKKKLPEVQFVLTTMTLHGRDFATQCLESDVRCLLAPLDVPGIVDRVIGKISPDLYVCLETELWPVVLRGLKRRGIPLILANGRMSENTADQYKRQRWFFGRVLANFSRLCLISETDRQRYRAIGVDERMLEVTGNLKYDRSLPTDPEYMQQSYAQLLGISTGQEVLFTGSTHTGEEELLIPAYQQLQQTNSEEMVWIVAPRHLVRLPEVVQLFENHGLQCDLLSDLSKGAERSQSIVIVDSFGELARMYSIGSYIFCGGSLVARRGHNIMEPALWNRIVFYGPSMADFRDAVDLLEAEHCGFMVNTPDDIVTKIEYFRKNPEEYRKACNRAGRVARSQQGAANRQAERIVDLLGVRSED